MASSVNFKNLRAGSRLRYDTVSTIEERRRKYNNARLTLDTRMVAVLFKGANGPRISREEKFYTLTSEAATLIKIGDGGHTRRVYTGHKDLCRLCSNVLAHVKL